jgi:homoserine kinase type II
MKCLPESEIDRFAADAAGQWGLAVRRIRRDIQIAGSPDRSELRLVIESDTDLLFVLESLFEADVEHKLDMTTCLKFLSEKGLPEINPYLSSASGKCIVESGNRFWRISPFVCGIPLNRPEYVWEGWRGEAMADFLIRQNAMTQGIPFIHRRSVFSITDYIQKLLTEIRRHDPNVFPGIEPVNRFIEKRFMKIHDQIPLSFCHGDFHPLNVIWSSDGIQAVIDWEFMGIKPEIYDAATLIGCIGIEDPQALIGDMARKFISRLKQARWISDIGWNVLIEFVIAVRFAWLSEWLRHRDREMIEMETVYMNLLVEHADWLKKTLIS